MPRLAVLVTLALLVACPGHAATIHVPGDQPTIQAGIDVAQAGDVVVVASGTYTGVGNRDLVFYTGRPITVRSETGDPDDCIIDCEGAGRGFFVEDVPIVLEGITVVNGMASYGGGIRLSSAATASTVSDCVFSSCTAWDGGGIYVDTNATVRRCVFSSCTAFFEGGGAVVAGDHPVFEACSFVGNVADSGGGLMFWYLATLTDCSIVGNVATDEGGGVGLDWAIIVQLTNCLIADNEAAYGGGIAVIALSHAYVIGCTITGNAAASGGGIWMDDIENSLSVGQTIISFSVQGSGVSLPWGDGISCTDMYGNAGGDWTGNVSGLANIYGNFSADPLFCDPENGDFTLSSQSPCLPGNHPDGVNCDLIGAFDQGCAPVSLVEESWAGIKGRYR